MMGYPEKCLTNEGETKDESFRLSNFGKTKYLAVINMTLIET